MLRAGKGELARQQAGQGRTAAVADHVDRQIGPGDRFPAYGRVRVEYRERDAQRGDQSQQRQQRRRERGADNHHAQREAREPRRRRWWIAQVGDVVDVAIVGTVEGQGPAVEAHDPAEPGAEENEYRGMGFRTVGHGHRAGRCRQHTDRELGGQYGPLSWSHQTQHSLTRVHACTAVRRAGRLRDHGRCAGVTTDPEAGSAAAGEPVAADNVAVATGSPVGGSSTFADPGYASAAGPQMRWS